MSLDLHSLRARMREAAGAVRLPLRSGRWTGQAGSVLGMGTGSSVDFQDQRSYLPGDDPRYINWQAYARTGSSSMKLYRQEVSPRVDLLVDLSESMFNDSAKSTRSWELIYWAVESALRWGASLKVIRLSQGQCSEVPMTEVMACDWSLPESNGQQSQVPDLHRAPLRPGSLRVLISDLLFPGAPQPVTTALHQAQGRSFIFSPFSGAEAAPQWAGNVEFEDAESRGIDKRRVTPDVLHRYREAYTRHFGLWREQCQRFGLPLVRVSAEEDFIAALRGEGLLAGAVEVS